MLCVLKGEGQSQHSEVFWERRGDKAGRVGHLKWVDSERGGGLFDLSKDVGEQHNLSGEKPEWLAKLRSRFRARRQQMQHAEPRAPFRDF